MPYSFAEESDIRRIIRSVLATEREQLNKPKRRGNWQMPGAVQTYAARVNDAGGIPALAGVTPGEGTVDVYEISGGTLTAIAAMAGITAYNSSSSAAADDDWVVIARDPYTGSWSIVPLGGGSNVVQTRVGYTGGSGMAKRIGSQMSSTSVDVHQGNGSGVLSDTGSNVVAWNISEWDDISSGRYVLLQWEPTGSIWIAHEVKDDTGDAGTTDVTVVTDVDYASGELRQTQQVLTVTATGATSTAVIFQADTVTVVKDVDWASPNFRETNQTLTILDAGATSSNNVFAVESLPAVVSIDYSGGDLTETHRNFSVFDGGATSSATVFSADTIDVVVDVDFDDPDFEQTKKQVTLLNAGSNTTSVWVSGTTC